MVASIPIIMCSRELPSLAAGGSAEFYGVRTRRQSKTATSANPQSADELLLTQKVSEGGGRVVGRSHATVVSCH